MHPLLRAPPTGPARTACTDSQSTCCHVPPYPGWAREYTIPCTLSWPLGRPWTWALVPTGMALGSATVTCTAGQCRPPIPTRNNTTTALRPKPRACGARDAGYGVASLWMTLFHAMYMPYAQARCVEPLVCANGTTRVARSASWLGESWTDFCPPGRCGPTPSPHHAPPRHERPRTQQSPQMGHPEFRSLAHRPRHRRPAPAPARCRSPAALGDGHDGPLGRRPHETEHAAHSRRRG